MTGLGAVTRRAGLALALAAVPLLGACKLGGDCRLSGVYGVQVAVEDTFTSDAIAINAFGTAASADGYVDTLEIVDTDISGAPWHLGGVLDRPGTYDVVVKKSGYYDWQKEQVPVASGGCGVVPALLRARMCPIGVGACDSTHSP